MIRYSDGLEIAYRWVPGEGITPPFGFGFGFGFGLPYTTFDVADVVVKAPDDSSLPVTVTASVTNDRSRRRRRGGAGVTSQALDDEPVLDVALPRHRTAVAKIGASALE